MKYLSFPAALFLVFLVLKLLNITVVATWSWWLVTMPLWLGTAVILGIVGVLFGGAVFMAYVAKFRQYRNRRTAYLKAALND